jgi:lipopolysaccharide/colanic/teichoic acid biosynthesis glycosyltransferase
MSDKLTIQMVNTLATPRSGKSGTQAVSSPSEKRINLLPTYIFWKGILDRLIALITIVVSCPLIAVIAMVIRLDSPGNPIYRRYQIGEKGRTFKIYKFRTMHVNNDDGEYKSYIARYVRENAPYTVGQDGKAVFKVVNDPRVTRFGAWLRKTNLDELPQLVNVLKGEMSFIGPRPDIPFAVSMYKDWHHKRLGVKPGITGLWQVCRRKNLSFEGMVRLDIDYIKRQSFLLDAKILFLTAVTVIRRDGSS